MATRSLEERVAVLESQVARLTEQVAIEPPQKAVPWWEKRFGAFKDNSLYDEAMELGAQYRRSQPTPADEDVSA
jgi:hypothetical protein